MQEKITAARPYAQAVFEQAREDNNLDAWSTTLNLLNMIVSDSQMQMLLKNPTIKADSLADMIIEICGNEISGDGKNFIRLLARSRRLSLAPHIRSLFEQQRADAEGVIEVTVESAYPLGKAEITRVADAMAGKLGKKINITTNVNEKLIGGVVIRAGDSVIDASVMGRLRQLGTSLAE